jgi:LysR family cys regulon transcriptional activator
MIPKAPGMHLRQLLYVREIVERGFRVGDAARALHTSQPSVSRQVQALEHELGVAIFVRRNKRFLGLTKPGAEVLRIAGRVLRDTENLRLIAQEFTGNAVGSLTVSTSHTQARYVLPRVVRAFASMHPDVTVILRQGAPHQTVQWVHDGEADLSISSDSTADIPDDVVLLPCYDHHKIVLVPADHPLLALKSLTLKALARYPLITYGTSSVTNAFVMQAFAAARLTPKIVLTATDVDVMKTYVKSGLGVAIVAELAYDAKEDRTLRAIGARHLFAPSRISIGIAKNSYLRSYAYDFIRLFSPDLTRTHVESAVFADR